MLLVNKFTVALCICYALGLTRSVFYDLGAKACSLLQVTIVQYKDSNFNCDQTPNADLELVILNNTVF